MRLILALALICIGAPARAEENPQAARIVQDQIKAHTELTEMIAKANEGSGSAPRAADSRALALLRALTDARLLSDTRYAASQINDQLSECSRVNALNAAYAMFDLKKSIAPALAPEPMAQRLAVVIDSNVVRFQSEISNLMPFLLRCMAESVVLIEAFAAALPPQDFTDVRRQGLAKMRGGIASVYVGALSVAIDARFEAAFRDALLTVLAETAWRFAAVLPLAQRQQIVQSIDGATPSAPQEHARRFERMREAMSDQRCDGLCKMKGTPLFWPSHKRSADAV